MIATDGTWRLDEQLARVGRAHVDGALRVSVVLVLAVALFIAARRASGAFDSPLPAGSLFVTAVGLLAWAAAVRLCLRDRRVNWLLAIVLALFAIGCSYPGERTIDWLVWLLAFAAFGLVSARRSSPAFESDKATGVVLQELTRTRGADGVETIRGSLVAEFAPGDRIAVLHVAFCPPFERLPEVRAEKVAGPACQVKVAQILQQGARFEVRLARASTAIRQAAVEFAASAPRPLEN